MASIENRSRFKVSVRNRDDLTKTFTYTAKKAVQAYLRELRDQGFKPKLSTLDDCYAVRIRQIGYADQCLFASSAEEAVEIKQQIESERRRGILTDYTAGWKVTFADLLIRYLREESPRHKTFVIEGYKINAFLEDAGLPRQDLAEILAAHKNPHPKFAGTKMSKPTGKRMSAVSETIVFIRRPFASLVPDDFVEFIDERCQSVEESSVDRELDLFAAVCNIAITTWRIPVAKSPMDGVRRPRYFNERDRRLKSDEEARLLEAARHEDRDRSVSLHLEQLMSSERELATAARTTYQRKSIVKAARAAYMGNAEQSHPHVALLETFVQFQLMTGARRSETLSLTWANLDLDMQTAFLPETKNGRSRKLSLRTDLVKMLCQLPRDNPLIFPIRVDGLRKAWARMCEEAGLVGENELHIHDLRHEAISRVAEAGSHTPGGFSLVDLQAFSGHRDTRMLLRYAHLCAHSLAKRLDAAFADKSQTTTHHGRRRLSKNASVSLGELAAPPAAILPTFDYRVTIPSLLPSLVRWGEPNGSTSRPNDVPKPPAATQTLPHLR